MNVGTARVEYADFLRLAVKDIDAVPPIDRQIVDH
jgi:hypothetical protein